MQRELTLLDYEALNALLIKGRSYLQINEELGVTRARLRYLLLREDVKSLVEEIKVDFTQGLDNLSHIVLHELKSELRHPDPRIRQAAVDKWLKAMGYYSRDVRDLAATAEDIAKMLLQGKDPEVSPDSGSTPNA